MNVLALTILISLILAGIFIVCFTCEILKPRKSSLEQISLLPLDDQPAPAQPTNQSLSAPLTHAQHDDHIR